MSSDTRVLIIVLAVVGILSCGCLCLPFGAALSLPVIANFRKVAEKAQAEREAKDRSERAAARARLAPPPPPRNFNRPPVGPPSEAFTPPDFQIPTIPAPEPPQGRPPVAERPSGLGALSEAQRQLIYRSATFHERMQETVKKQIQMLRERQIDTSHLERVLAEREKHQEEQLKRLCQSHRISREELEQIIAEGKRRNW